ncbi:MAG: sodium:solute symporter family protein [Cyclobacteriaceae bacterium]
MQLVTIDWIIITAFFAISLGVGLWVAKSSNNNVSEYFAAGKNMPWWLLGVSMVATTFSTDTPNLVTDIVRQHGVSGNWSWWAFLFTGMLTVFVYARLWKRTGILTDVEFYELRYSGKIASFLRGFRAVYLGLVFNVMIMATVTLAAIKIGGVLLGISPIQTVLIAGTVTVIYSSLGGLKGVLITDFIQFFLSITGAIIAAVVSLQHPMVNGLSNLISHENVVDKLAFFPSLDNPELLLSILLVPLLVQWWSVWYPGAEPGGGGYIAQRMFAAKNENHAMKAVLFFNVAHYALRPWPWIIVALCSLIVFPDLVSLENAFPASAAVINHDLAYPAMLTFIPAGLLGIVITSLIAAYMSTISTHLNWGASYLVNDFYSRYLKPDASQKELLFIGRIITALLMILSMILALNLENALGAFQILLQIGAGTGLIFILRWFWWRVNAQGEIAAMLISFLVAIYFQFVHSALGFNPLASYLQLSIGVAITSIVWIIVVLVTPAADNETLINFVKLVKPGGPGWKKVIRLMPPSTQDQLNVQWNVPKAILMMLIASVGVYCFMIGTGFIIYTQVVQGSLLYAISIVAILWILKLWKTEKL